VCRVPQSKHGPAKGTYLMPRAHIFQVVALCVAGQFGPFAQAQVDTGSITGVVTDSSGALVPDAQVTITETQTNVRFAVTTNGSGFFSTPSLHPGPYQLEVAKQGFQTQKQTGINLRVQDRLELNFSLALGATATEITVNTSAPPLESET